MHPNQGEHTKHPAQPKHTPTNKSPIMPIPKHQAKPSSKLINRIPNQQSTKLPKQYAANIPNNSQTQSSSHKHHQTHTQTGQTMPRTKPSKPSHQPPCQTIIPGTNPIQHQHSPRDAANISLPLLRFIRSMNTAHTTPQHRTGHTPNTGTANHPKSIGSVNTTTVRTHRSSPREKETKPTHTKPSRLNHAPMPRKYDRDAERSSQK